MWPIFHGPVTLSYISKTIWCMIVIFSDNETVWPKLWRQSKYKSTWPIFHGLMILHNFWLPLTTLSGMLVVSSLFADWAILGFAILYRNSRFCISSICRSVTYILWSSDFASYLEDKRCTWDNGSLWLKDQPYKIYVGQWHILHVPLTLTLYHCQTNYFYT